ncbi:MAG: outer membrane beta-barrel protein, partial [Salinimicrobium sp.]
KENLLNDKLSITLTATDIFHTYKIQRSTYAEEFTQKTAYQRLQPVILLGIAWRFNQFQDADEIEYLDQGL